MTRPGAFWLAYFAAYTLALALVIRWLMTREGV